jgi:hypothetical protein
MLGWDIEEALVIVRRLLNIYSLQALRHWVILVFLLKPSVAMIHVSLQVTQTLVNLSVYLDKNCILVQMFKLTDSQVGAS